jgi:hypothetical protein
LIITIIVTAIIAVMVMMMISLIDFDLRNDSTPRSPWFMYGTYHEHASLWLRLIRLAI